MGIFKNIVKGVGKVFKNIGKGVTKVFKKFGKFMNKIGIVGNIAMMFILPGIGAALAKGFGAIWTGAIGQTAAQATAAANAATAVAGNTATQAAIAGATDVAAGEVIKQTALKAATKTAMEGIRAGTTAITQKATGMLASEYAVVKGAGLVLQKGAQFASTIASGYKTVSQAVTGAFTETGKWIGGKLGMKTAEGAAMQGSWANYSKAVTDSFNDFKGNVADFWSPIKDGPTIDVGIKDLTNEVADATGNVVNSTSNIASATGSDLNVSGEFGTGATVPRSDLNVSGEFGTGATVSEPVNSLLDKKGSYFKDTVLKGKSIGENLVDYKDGVVADIIATPGNMLKQEAANAIFGQEPLAIEEPLNLWDQAGYTPQLPVGNADIYAQAAAPVSDFVQFITGNEQTFGNYGVKEGQFGGASAFNNYFTRLQNFGATD